MFLSSYQQHISDKVYWHRYADFYDKFLESSFKPDRILEFGLFKGDSIRWLKDRYPAATIVGADILPLQTTWPVAENIFYEQLDQGNILDIQKLFKKQSGSFDLIIEDGSHFPEHQKNCLVESIKHLKNGGIYILEDIHTSHPDHFYYQRSSMQFANTIELSLFKLANRSLGLMNTYKEKLLFKNRFLGPLQVLLWIEHCLHTNFKPDRQTIEAVVADRSIFSVAEIQLLFTRISEINFYRRASLPDSCFLCGSTEFNYKNLLCVCGNPVYHNADSMTAIIRMRA